MDNTEYLIHYGVLGMKWGVRRNYSKDGYSSKHKKSKLEKAEAKKLKKEQKQWDKNFNKNWWKAYNNAADYTNFILVPKLNKKYEKYDWSQLNLKDAANPKGDPELVAAFNKYSKEYHRKFEAILQKSYDDMFGKRPE